MDRKGEFLSDFFRKRYKWNFEGLPFVDGKDFG